MRPPCVRFTVRRLMLVVACLAPFLAFVAAPVWSCCVHVATLRISRIRFTVRGMMLTVGVVAVVCWIGLLAWRSNRLLELSQEYRHLADVYGQGEQVVVRRAQEIARLEQQIAWTDKLAAESRGLARFRVQDHAFRLRAKLEAEKQRLLVEGETPVRYSALREYYELLVEKYRRAATRPWVLADPDPARP